MSWYLIPLAVMVGLCGVAAWKDKTPRKPWVWRRPDLEFWAVKRTQRETQRHHVRVGKDKAA